jgi:hypothetical protein
MVEIKKAQIPAEHVVTSQTVTYDRTGKGDMVTMTTEYATGRTSKGDHTHIVHASVLGGFSTNCGLDGHGRMRHSVWTTQPSRITCEKCNGEKPRSKKADQEYMRAFAAQFGK